MIHYRTKIMVEGVRWHVTFFFPVTDFQIPRIMGALRFAGCTPETGRSIWANLTSRNINNGITYSNYWLRESVVVFDFSSAPWEYFSLIAHELHHLSVHIADAHGYDLKGEDVCYLNGDLARMLWPVARNFIM